MEERQRPSRNVSKPLKYRDFVDSDLVEEPAKNESSTKVLLIINNKFKKYYTFQTATQSLILQEPQEEPLVLLDSIPVWSAVSSLFHPIMRMLNSFQEWILTTAIVYREYRVILRYLEVIGNCENGGEQKAVEKCLQTSEI